MGDMTALGIHEVPRSWRGEVPRFLREALTRRAVGAVSAVSADKEKIPRELTFMTSVVVTAAKEVAQETETDLDTDTLTSRRVGRILQKMRWRSVRTNRAKG
jgi:hypothetical protein